MATYTTTSAGDTYPTKAVNAGQCITIADTIELAVAIDVNDVIELCKLPDNAKVVDLKLWGDELDTDGTPTLTMSLGLDYDPDYFLADSTMGQDAFAYDQNEVFPDGVKAAVTQDCVLQLTVTAAPTAGGTGTVSFLCTYQLQPSLGD